MVLRRKFNGAKVYTEAWDGVQKYIVVGERSVRGEVKAEALVDCTEERMPE